MLLVNDISKCLKIHHSLKNKTTKKKNFTLDISPTVPPIKPEPVKQAGHNHAHLPWAPVVTNK